jgi:hypothetical protein
MLLGRQAGNRSDDQVERAADIADLLNLPMQQISARCAAA